MVAPAGFSIGSSPEEIDSTFVVPGGIHVLMKSATVAVL